jgi:hypothetical protein
MGKRSKSASIDISTDPIFGPPPILEQEDSAAFDALHKHVTKDVQPVGILEKIWVWEIVVLTWEILRWYRVKNELVKSGLPAGLAEILRPYAQTVHRETPEYEKAAKIGTMDAMLKHEANRPLIEEHIAQGWAAKDPDHVAMIDEFVASGALSMDQVMSKAFVENLDPIERIDRLIMSAENRRNAALREIERHRRSFAQALRDAVEDADFEIVKPNSEKKAA